MVHLSYKLSNDMYTDMHWQCRRNGHSCPHQSSRCSPNAVCISITKSTLRRLDSRLTHECRLQTDYYQTQASATRPTPPAKSQVRPSFYRSSLRHFRETFDILFSIHRVEGWRGLFKGLGPSLTGVVPASAVKFYTYGNCKRLFPELIGCEKDSTVVHALSAACAGIATGSATNPIWVVKTRLQLDKAGARRYKGSLDCISQILKHEGPKGLYRGLTASYLGTIETTLHLAMYERFKSIISRKVDLEGDKEANQFVQGLAMSGASGLSKLCACLIAYPHEVSLSYPATVLRVYLIYVVSNLLSDRLFEPGYGRLRWQMVGRNTRASSSARG